MRILAIGIHPDDVEIGCGGTVAACAAAGDDVTILDLTRGESSSNGTPETRAGEAREAATILGCARRVNALLPDAGIQSENPAHVRAVVCMLRAYRPHVVLIPNPDDPHPDHELGGKLSLRAIFLSHVAGFATDNEGRAQERWRVERTLLYNGRREVRADLVMDITGHFETKVRAIRAHASQVAASETSLATPLNDGQLLQAVEARAILAGRRIGVAYGEPFEMVAPVAVRDFRALAGGAD